MKKIKFSGLSLAIAACFCLTANLHAGTPAPTNSTEAILKHPGFHEGLVWIGKEPGERESARLLQIIGDLNKPYWPAEVEKFLEDYPDSPWAASLHYAYASFCHRTGRTSKALEHWEAGWNLVKDDTSVNGRRLGGAILANWTEQLSSLGRRDKLRELIPAGDRWPFANRQDRQSFQAAKNNYHIMSRHPELSYRCGTLALKAVGQVLQPTNQTLQSLVEIGSPVDGFSMSGLANLSKQYGLDLVAVRRTQGQDLIVPSVIHWRQNHYAAILKQDGNNYLVNDPTFGKPRWMQPDAINEEASGFFLIPSSKQTSHWQTLSSVELASIYGKGLTNNVNDALDKGCTTVAGGAQECNCGGMPVWWVSEPYNNVWIADEPLSYLTSTGEPFTFRFSYKQRDSRPQMSEATRGGVADAGWNMSWFSSIRVESTTAYDPDHPAYPALSNSPASLYLANGGEVDFAAGQSYDQETRLLLLNQCSQLQEQDDGENGLVVIHADGSQDVYGYGIYSTPIQYDYDFINYVLTRHIDPHGNVTTLYYTNAGDAGEIVPLYIVDYDGRTNTLSYSVLTGTNVNYLGVLTHITGPYGQNVQLNYDVNGNLTNIIDAQGLSSTVTYDSNGYPTSLVTPYGTNTFTLYKNAAATTTNSGDGNFGTDSPPYVDRAEVITDPIGGTHLYLYQFDCAGFMGTNYSSSDVPTNTPLGTLDAGTGSTNSISGVNFRNSFSWNARQYAALSTTNFLGFTTNDYLRGRMKHWLQDTNNLYVSEYLSVERDPSPDGATAGLMKFYDYQGKSYNYQAGTNPVPSVTAWCLPGGETHYEYVQYNYFGGVTNRVTTYTTTNGTLGTRTNQFFYADNTYTNVFYWPYTSGYSPLYTYTFTVPNLLTKVVAANGSNVWTFGQFDVVAWTNYFLSGYYSQTNQIVLSALRVLPDFATNGLNQTTAFTFTGFNKITGIQWPAGLTTTNIYYPNGFLAQTIDLQTQRTNGFAYSTNGLPSTFTNELGLVVNFSWDNLLRPTGAYFPADGTTISNVYYRLDRSAHKDRLGNWTYFGYDGLRHLTARTNANSNVTLYGWCDCGALTSITNALTNITSFSYDNQDRRIGVSFPDGSSVAYQYDLAGRRTNTSDGSGAAVNLAYNNQSWPTNISNPYGSMAHAIFDILDRPDSFTDANNITLTNTFDMLNRLVSRVWTVDGIGEGFLYGTNGLIAYTNRDSQVTRFVRDAAERLTAITNANIPPSVTQFAYDPASDLINLTDGLGHSNVWNYNPLSWVTNKIDASNHQAFAYSYNANGWPTNRWMPASGNTQYKFDAVGNLTNIVYSNTATASISYSYDADNRLTNMIDAVGTTVWTYNSNGLVASETLVSAASPWMSNTVSYAYNQGHRTGLILLQPTGGAWAQSYSYDSAWRLTNLSSPAGAFGYSYPASASRLVLGVALPNAAYITNQYDSLARLTNTSLVTYWGHVLDGYGYAYDPLGLRTNISRYLGIATNNIAAGYDNIGQLTSWSAKETSNTSRLNEQLSYAYDAADNLEYRTNNDLSQSFVVDALNQLSTVSRGSVMTVIGNTPAPASNVAVNGNLAQTYSDFTFASTNNTLNRGTNLTMFTIVATNAYGVSATNAITGDYLVNVEFTSDLNGNLISDGTRNFVFDAENELTNVYVTNLWQTQFVYDGLRRRRIEKDFAWQSGWVQTNEIHYVYDGMLVIQERASNNAVQVTYTRGLDLKGGLQRAGGIGGLLARTDTNGSAFYHADGAGNITALINENQNVLARYEYDPFGRLLGMWGALAGPNRIRFSSFLAISGIVFSPTRPYFPELQRWGSQDPIGLAGGINPFRFVGNSPVNFVDPFGLQTEAEGEAGVSRAAPAELSEEDQFEQALMNNQVFGAQRELTPVEEMMEQMDRDIAAANQAIAAEQAAQEAAQRLAEAYRSPDSQESEGANAPSSTVSCPTVGTVVYRNWGGTSGPFGRSWTTDPYTQQSRDSLGIGDWNTTEFLSFGEIVESLGITTRSALSAEGYGGGGQETLIPSPATQVQLNAVVMPDNPLPTGK